MLSKKNNNQQTKKKSRSQSLLWNLPGVWSIHVLQLTDENVQVIFIVNFNQLQAKNLYQ